MQICPFHLTCELPYFISPNNQIHLSLCLSLLLRAMQVFICCFIHSKLVNWERKISHWWFETPPTKPQIRLRLGLKVFLIALSFWMKPYFILRFWLCSIHSKLERRKAPVCNLYFSAILRNGNILHKHIALLLFLQAFQANFLKVFIPFCNKKDNGRHFTAFILVLTRFTLLRLLSLI